MDKINRKTKQQINNKIQKIKHTKQIKIHKQYIINK